MQKSLAVDQTDTGFVPDDRLAIGADSGWSAVPWSWSCVMTVCFDDGSSVAQSLGATLLVQPSLSGLKLIAELDTEVESISLFFPPRGHAANARTEVVRKILHWPTEAASGPCMALCCASGSIFICSESELQTIEPEPLWSTGRKYDLKSPVWSTRA